jgi:hypothetical protein
MTVYIIDDYLFYSLERVSEYLITKKIEREGE